MISDKEWLCKLGEWTDWQDESFGERELRNYMMLYDFARFHKAIKKEYKRKKAEELANKILKAAKEIEIQFTSNDTEIKKKFIKVLRR